MGFSPGGGGGQGSIAGGSDVALNNVTNTQGLVYDSTVSKWKNGPVYAKPLGGIPESDLSADVQSALSSGGGGGAGSAPNWIAAANASTAVKNAVIAGGGVVCDGTADQVQFAAKLASFGHVIFTEGTYYFSATLDIPTRCWLQGSGVKSVITGSSGLSSAFITIQGEHTNVTDFQITAGNEAAGTHHIDSNVTSNAGFLTGEDACTVIDNIVSRYAKGDAIRVTGTYNRDSKISRIHAWNAVGNGFYISTADGSINQCVAGTCGANGFELTSTSSNWRITNSKAWYSDRDGFRVDGGRHTLVAVEGQDNDWAGIRIIGDIISISGWLADSNSNGAGGSTANQHSGLEIGRTETGSGNGGYDISVGTGESWDKNEGSRGFQQRCGVRIRSGVRGLTMVGVQTGNPASNFKNVTAGIVFDTASDMNHANNFITGCLNHYVRMASS